MENPQPRSADPYFTPSYAAAFSATRMNGRGSLRTRLRAEPRTGQISLKNVRRILRWEATDYATFTILVTWSLTLPSPSLTENSMTRCAVEVPLTVRKRMARTSC